MWLFFAIFALTPIATMAVVLNTSRGPCKDVCCVYRNPEA